MRRAGAEALLLLAVCGCANLPVISTGVCGNAIVEAPEDCDTFSPIPGSVCRPSGSAGACHLDCRPRSDGTTPSCPGGWGCDADGLCREPTGDFEPRVEFQVGGAASLAAGDFDGDGRADVISSPPRDSYQRTRLRFHYFDEQGALAETRLFPKLLASPVIADVSGDHRSDLLFSDFRVGVLLGRSDRTLVPESFHSYLVPDARLRMLGVYDDGVGKGDPANQDPGLLALTTLGSVHGLFVPATSGRLILRGTLPGPVEALAGDAVSGDLIEGANSPCREVVFALAGASSFSLLDVCTWDSASGNVAWRDTAERWSIALDPPAPIAGTPQICDVNGDGHLDVLLGAGGRPYVAYGDGSRLATATPYTLQSATQGDAVIRIPVPLAAGDFTGDGAVDFVFPDGFLVSKPTPGSPIPTYVGTQGNMGAPWTVAAIADVNGNGKPDVVAASSTGFDIAFFNGMGNAHLIPASLPTMGSVRQLTVGDLDGDLTNDLAFLGTGGKGQDGDALMIAFGALGGIPAPAVQVARIRDPEQLGLYASGGIANLTLTANEVVDGHRNGTLTLLFGSSDRLPIAPYGLTRVTPDGVLETSSVAALVVGKFSAPGKSEVMAFAARDPKRDVFDLWLGPTAEAAGSTPVRLEGAIDPRLQPATPQSTGFRTQVVGSVADLDRDGRDEALWIMPADDGTHCALAIFDALRNGGATLVGRGIVFLEESCAAPALLPVDADADGWIDVAVLTGGEGGMDRRLLVLWNDGTGQLSSDDVSVVNGEGESPEAFTVLPATSAGPLRFAYVTRTAAMLVEGRRQREFGSPRPLLDLGQGSGVVAADVNGDRIADLVIADEGNVGVVAARLKTP